MLKMPCSSFSRRSEARCDNGAFKEVEGGCGFIRSPGQQEWRTVHTKCGMYLLASLLAAALPQGVLNILRGHDGI